MNDKTPTLADGMTAEQLKEFVDAGVISKEDAATIIRDSLKAGTEQEKTCTVTERSNTSRAEVYMDGKVNAQESSSNSLSTTATLQAGVRVKLGGTPGTHKTTHVTGGHCPERTSSNTLPYFSGGSTTNSPSLGTKFSPNLDVKSVPQNQSPFTPEVTPSGASESKDSVIQR